MAEKSGGRERSGKEMRSQDDSSDSENEAEPAKSFHRRMSTNREIKTTVSDSRLCFPRDSKSIADWCTISTVGSRDFPIFKVVFQPMFHQCLLNRIRQEILILTRVLYDSFQFKMNSLKG